MPRAVTLPPVPKYPAVRALPYRKAKKARYPKALRPPAPWLRPELPEPSLMERITGGTGAVLGALEKGYGYISEMLPRLSYYLPRRKETAQIPFSRRLLYALTTVERPKEVPTYERPFEAGYEAAKWLLERPGYDPGHAKKTLRGIAAGAAGMAAAIAMDPLAYLGIAEAKPAASIAGRAGQKLFAPFMAVPRGVSKYLVKPAETLLKGTRLAKPISGLRVLAAPFVLAGKTVQKISPKTAEAVSALGKGIAKRFRLTPVEKALKHDMNAAEAAIGSAADAVQAAEKGGIFARTNFLGKLLRWAALRSAGTKYAGKSEVLRKTLMTLGEAGMKAAADDLIRAGKGTLGQALIRAAEQGYDAGKALMKPISGEADDLFRGMVEEFRAASDDLFELKNKMRIATGEAAAAKLHTIRVNHVPHVVNLEALESMEKRGIFPKFMDILRDALKADPRGLTPEAVDDIIKQSWKHLIQGERSRELSRIPIMREFSIEEINKAAHKAGLKEGMELVTEHISAYSVKGRSAIARIAYGDARVAAAEAAEHLGIEESAKRIFGNSVKHDDWIRLNSHAVDRLDDLRKGVGRTKGLYFMRRGSEWVILNDDLGCMMENVKQITGQVGRTADTLWTRAAQWFNKVTSVYKGIVLNYSPSTTITNLYDDTIRFAVQEGMTAALDGYAMDAKIAAGGKQTFSFLDGLRGIDRAELDRLLLERGILTGQTAAEGQWQLRYGLRDLNEILENGRRRAFMLGALQKYSYGNDYAAAVQKAADAVESALFAYTDITPFEEKLAKGILFYRFFRKNISYQVRMLALYPWRQMLLYRAPALLFGEDPTFEEKRLLPEWLRMRNPFVVERRPDGTVVFNAGLRLSILDLNKLWPGQWYREGIGMLAPQFNIPLEAISGRYIFLDLPIEDIRRLYTPAIGKALEKLNPLYRGLTGSDFAHRVPVPRNDGTMAEWWVIPAWLAYFMSKLRPANDLRRILDPRNQNKIWFFVTGMKDYPYDIERLVEERIRESLDRDIAEQVARGTMGKREIYYMKQWLDAASPEAKEEAWLLYMKQRGLEKMSRARRVKRALK